jgi:predicted transposase YdaD
MKLQDNYDYYTELGEKRGEKRGIEIGEQRGIELGRSEGITAFIKLLSEENFSKERIVEKIVQMFSITNEDAAARYDSYIANNISI